jgi:hypothetical protein
MVSGLVLKTYFKTFSLRPVMLKPRIAQKSKDQIHPSGDAKFSDPA